MSAIIRIYRQGDEHRMTLRADMAEQYAAFGARVHDGPKWSLVDGDLVLAIGGAAYDENDDSHDLWLLSSGLRPRHWWQVFQRTRGLMSEIKGAGANERIWVSALACEGAVEFITRLGFKPSAGEGVYYV